MTYSSNGEREEIFSGFVPDMSFDQLVKIARCDMTLVNFISGRDMTMSTFEQFRAAYHGSVYFDFHTLSLGLRRDGRRFLRKPRKWEEYVACCDYLQLNRREFSLLSGKPPDTESLTEFFDCYVMTSSDVMLVTLGADGAVMVSDCDGTIEIRWEKPAGRTEISDTTGAGDLFASGFCAGLALDRPLAECLRLAVNAGTYGCSITHPQDVDLPVVE